MKCLDVMLSIKNQARICLHFNKNFNERSAVYNIQKIQRLLLNNEQANIQESRFDTLKNIIENYISGKLSVNKIPKLYLKYLIYHLDNIELLNPPLIENSRTIEILQYIDDHWHSAYLYPLIKLYFRNYRISYGLTNNARIIKSIISKYLPKYNGKNEILKILQKYPIDFNQNTGIENIAIYIINNYHGLYNMLESISKYKDLICSSYFGFILISILKLSQNKNEILNEYITTSNKINFSHNDIHKIVSSEIIILAKNVGIDNNKITSFAFNEIGDPGHISKWQIIDNALSTYKEIVNQARIIIANYINSEVIDFFFSKAVMDPERKAFWYPYSKKMQNVWIVANRNLINNIISFENNEILAWLTNRHIKIQNNFEDGLALIMEINNYIIVEVAKQGNACYIYSKNHYYYLKIFEIIEKRKIYSISYLKDTSIPVIKIYYFTPNLVAGKLIHSLGWQEKFKNILNTYIGV